jgi:hypothetical protein
MLLGKTQEKEIPNRFKKFIKEKVKYLGIEITKDEKETTEINIETAENKIDNLIKIWSKRRMPLSGKIAICKSLIIPQLTHILNTIASPPKKKIEELNRKLFRFINNNKREKIKRNIIINDYKNGGYKMTDLESYIEATKIRWMERLLKIKGVWKSEIIRKCSIDMEYLCRCNIKYKDLPFRTKFKNKGIWDEFWQLWCKENSYEVKYLDEILNQNIWLNSYIKIKNKVVHWKKWKNKKINWIIDLTKLENNRRRFMTKQELEETYNINISILEYLGIIDAIPQHWRRSIKNDNDDIESESEEDYKLIDQILDSKRPMNKIYQKLIRKKKERPTRALTKWKTELNINSTDQEILMEHNKNHWSTINNKLRSFNCNYLNRNIPTNKKLNEMKKRNDPNCIHCGEKEDYIHMYWNCETKKPIWNKLKELHELHTGKELTKEAPSCLLGINIKDDTERTLNLLTKHYLHLNKCDDDKKPSTKGLELYIKNYLKIEKECSKLKGTINKFNNTWTGWADWT